MSNPGKAVIQSNLQQAATQKAKVWRSLTCGGRFRVPSKLVSSEWSPHPPPPSQYYCAVLYFRISLLMKSPPFSHSYSDYPNQWQRLEKKLNSLSVTRARKNPEFQHIFRASSPHHFSCPGQLLQCLSWLMILLEDNLPGGKWATCPARRSTRPRLTYLTFFEPFLSGVKKGWITCGLGASWPIITHLCQCSIKLFLYGVQYFLYCRYNRTLNFSFDCFVQFSWQGCC